MSNPVLDDTEIKQHLQTLPHWSVRDGTLSRTVRTQDWRATLMVVNAIGHLAEAAWHHPDLAVSFAKVEIHLSTHDAGGITAKDFALAQQIEDVVLTPPKLRGNPKGYIKYDDEITAGTKPKE